MTEKSERLREARIKASYESASAAADAFGWTASAYRHHENGTRDFDVDAAKRYGKAFKVNPGWLLALDKITAPPMAAAEGSAEIEVVGSVAAGVWQETYEWPREKRFSRTVGPSPFPGARRFGLKVEGNSMDREFPPETILDCVSIFDVQIPPATGDYVIAERIRPDGLREATVKKFHVDDEGRHWLVPESNHPDHQSWIEVGLPQGDDFGEEIRVIAYVIGDYKPRAQRLLNRAGKHRA